MRLPISDVEETTGDALKSFFRPNKLSCGEKRPHLIILLQEELARYGRGPHVISGCNHMSNGDTRVSVIVGVCQHDPERWREFDAIYRPILFAFLHKQGLKDGDASDVVQDIFVKLLEKIHTYKREKCRFRTWLFSVTHNTLVDHARRRASYKKAVEGWAAHVLRATPSDSIMMEEAWRRLHRETILRHALKVVRARVSSKAWACFEQRLIRGRPAAEIAAELKIAPNLVHVNACRVMKQVREVCQEFDEDISHAFESDLSK